MYHCCVIGCKGVLLFIPTQLNQSLFKLTNQQEMPLQWIRTFLRSLWKAYGVDYSNCMILYPVLRSRPRLP